MLHVGEVIEVKAKYSKDDKLFICKEDPDRGFNTLIPVSIGGVSNVKLYGAGTQIITYSVSSIKNRVGFEVNEIDLFSITELDRFLK